jgi:hypothetical protein
MSGNAHHRINKDHKQKARITRKAMSCSNRKVSTERSAGRSPTTTDCNTSRGHVKINKSILTTLSLQDYGVYNIC